MKKILVIVVAIIVVLGVGYVGIKGVRKMMRESEPIPAAMTPAMSPTSMMTPSATTGGAMGGIYRMETSKTLGQYLADAKGMTLYVFDKDTKGVSNCDNNACATTWLPYQGATEGSFPANITVIRLVSGENQYAWKDRPLYYYAPDKVPGDTTGEGVGGVWHVAK